MKSRIHGPTGPAHSLPAHSTQHSLLSCRCPQAAGPKPSTLRGPWASANCWPTRRVLHPGQKQQKDMWVFGYLQAPEHGERRAMCCGDTTWTPSGGLQPARGPRQNASAGSLLLLLPCTGCGQRCGDRCHSAWAAPGLPRMCSSRPEGMMPTQAIKRPANNKSQLTAQAYLVISLLTKISGNCIGL